MTDKEKTILVTGAAGMIGLATVKGLLDAGHSVVGIDRRDSDNDSEGYIHYTVDLSDKEALKKVVEENGVDRIIHLAALAHSVDGKEYSWEDYRHLNVECAKNVFEAAGELPLLFISTVDVYGFTKGTVNVQAELNPVSHYAKSKMQAEEECKKLPNYTVFRFSPVYTDEIKRDIQKRYYLKYPNIAYKIGKGTEYEVLNIKNAVSAMVEWCKEDTENSIRIIKNTERMNTVDCIKAEKAEGRAKLVLWIPRWTVKMGYAVLKALTGENKYTYLLNKAVNPLRSE